jgi:hypothetical protein
MDAAAREIVSRHDPVFGKPVKSGIPYAAIIARLECERDLLERKCRDIIEKFPKTP